MENFIRAYWVEDTSLCDRLIDYHSQANTAPGRIYSTKPDVESFGVIKEEVKKSTDCYVLPEDLIKPENKILVELIDQVQKASNQYCAEFPEAMKFGDLIMREPINIQYYKPGEAYYEYHTERGINLKEPYITNRLSDIFNRHLVWMLYLNDVFDEGGTEFKDQKITATARKGKILIWPADWMHTHRGIASPTEEKWIATGWIHIDGGYTDKFLKTENKTDE